MKDYEATEIAYKRGYEQGMKDAVKHGMRTHRTIWHTSGWGEIYTSYNCCGFQERGKTHHNFCPNCGAKMDLED